MKKIKYIVIGLLVIVLAAVVGAMMFMQSIVKSAVHKYGSEIVGTNVELQGFSLNLLQGTASIKGLAVANPKGYSSPYLLNLGGISVSMDPKSIFEDTIIIHEIAVNKPTITYEMLSLNQNNIKQIQENIAKNTASAPKVAKAKPAKAEKPVAKDAKPAKNVVIHKVIINAGEVDAVVPNAVKNADLSVVLPEITLTNIGGKKEGTSIAASISQILTKVLQVATQTVVNSNLSNLQNLAKDNLNNAVNNAKDRVKEIGIFGNL